MDWIHGKYTITEEIGSRAYRLNVPGAIHNVFHTCLLKPSPSDPFPSQVQTDHQPPALLTNEAGKEKWVVESILEIRKRKIGRGIITEALVKWAGYQSPTWEPLEHVEETAALARFEREREARSREPNEGGR